MNTRYDVSLMVNVAQMYYGDGLKQDEIAGQLQISRSMISMILTEAKEVGIVDIKVRNPMLNNEALAHQLMTLFHLRDCIVVPTSIQDVNTLRQLVAQRTGQILNGLLNNQYSVGITWGRTCYELVTSFPPGRDFKDISVVSLIGGSNQTAQYFQLNEMVRVLAEKLGGTPFFIHGPALASSDEEREFFIRSSAMQTIIEKWRSIDIVITGIGTLPEFNTHERETYIGEREIFRQLEGNKAVGDICARYFKIDGEFIQGAFNEKVIGIPVRDLFRAKTVVAIAANSEKSRALLGALRTGLIHILITEEQTAKAVLKEV